MSTSKKSGGFLPKAFGIGLGVTGAAHFVVPEAFAAIAYPKTRKIGLLGLGAYLGWLGFNVARNS